MNQPLQAAETSAPGGRLAELYTVEDLVARYDVSDKRLLELIRDGHLVAFKLGRSWEIHVDDWNAYIDSLRTAAASR